MVAGHIPWRPVTCHGGRSHAMAAGHMPRWPVTCHGGRSQAMAAGHTPWRPVTRHGGRSHSMVAGHGPWWRNEGRGGQSRFHGKPSCPSVGRQKAFNHGRWLVFLSQKLGNADCTRNGPVKLCSSVDFHPLQALLKKKKKSLKKKSLVATTTTGTILKSSSTSPAQAGREPLGRFVPPAQHSLVLQCC